MKAFLKTIPLCLTLLLLTPGCVYWRLYQFRSQMSSFPDYYRIETNGPPTIVASKPVLQPDDLGWLTGLEPTEKTQHDDGSTLLHYRFVTQSPTGGSPDYDVELQVLARDNRLIWFQFPERFAPVLTEKNFESVFREMERGRLERAQNATDWSWAENEFKVPRREDVLLFWGEPYSEVHAEETFALTYAYRLKGSTNPQNTTGWEMFMRYEFNKESGFVQASDIYLGRLRVRVVLMPGNNSVNIKRY